MNAEGTLVTSRVIGRYLGNMQTCTERICNTWQKPDILITCTQRLIEINFTRTMNLNTHSILWSNTLRFAQDPYGVTFTHLWNELGLECRQW